MSSVNKVILIGRLGRDPEIRTTNSGERIANLNVATSERWKDKLTGDPVEKTEWHRVVIFNDSLASVCEKYLKKGSQVYIEGQLQTREWKDRDGVTKYTTEIVLKPFNGVLTMLDKASGQSEQDDGVRRYNPEEHKQTKPAQDYDTDEEIPY